MNAIALWYLTRGTGVVALLLLTLVVLLGVTSTFRWRSRLLPKFLVAGLHRNLTLLALAFVAVHVGTSVVDGYAPIRVVDAVVPFVSAYRPVWLGLGALALDLLLALVATSLLRARVGLRLWRGLHWSAYAAWPVALVHGLGTGTDPRTAWLQALTAACAGSVVAATLARTLGGRGPLLVRTGAAGAALVLPLAVLVWARGGPLATGWAQRSGTPATLLRGGTSAATVAVRVVRPSFVSPPFDASFTGTLAASPWREGLVHVAIQATTSGAADGRLHVDIYGEPLEDGGVAMTASRATFGPASSPRAYAGSIAALDGGRLRVALRSAAGDPLELRLHLRIDGQSVSGSLHGEIPSGPGA